jgi:hypothetical protein
VVGAAAEAGIIGGYPDGSFGPKRPTTRAEAVAILDRALPAPVGTEETTTTTGSSSDGSSDSTGRPSAYLTAIRIDGVNIPSFYRNTRTYTHETNNPTAKVEGVVENTSYKVEYSVNNGSYNTTVPTAAPVEGTVIIRVSRSGYNTTSYTVNLKKPGGGAEELPWEQILTVETENLTQPSTPNILVTAVEITVKSDYVSLVSGITVRGFSAEKTSNPAKWLVTVIDIPFFTREELISHDRGSDPKWLVVTIEPSSGNDWNLIDRTDWPAPVTKVEARNGTQPITPNILMTELRITVSVPTGGVLNGITIAGNWNAPDPVTLVNATTWTGWIFDASVAQVTANFRGADIVPDYSYSTPAQPDGVITRLTALYSDFGLETDHGYVVSVYVKPAEVSNVDDITIVDNTTNEELGTLKKGTLLPEYFVPYKFNTNIFPSAPGSRSGSVSVTVTLKDGGQLDSETVDWGDDISL